MLNVSLISVAVHLQNSCDDVLIHDGILILFWPFFFHGWANLLRGTALLWRNDAAANYTADSLGMFPGILPSTAERKSTKRERWLIIMSTSATPKVVDMVPLGWTVNKPNSALHMVPNWN